MSRRDAMAVYDDVLAAATADDPWLHAAGEPPRYAADYELLADMLTIPRRAGSVSETGVFPRGIDLWLSHELRRAGFTDQETWPRASAPRVLPREIHLLLESLPRRVRQAPGFDVREWLTERVAAMPSITPIDARILGRAYDKQVDVCVSRWDTGPELLISTKAQVASFGKNLPNRYEEALGDAANLMARYPLAAVGFFFVQRATILRSEPDAFERTVDMMRKLRQDSVVAGGAYTATGLCLVDWPEGEWPSDGRVEIVHDAVPEDLRADQFLTALVRKVVEVSPVSHHTAVRGLLERRTIPVAEDAGPGLYEEPPEDVEDEHQPTLFEEG